jgi:hypothetical protein
MVGALSLDDWSKIGTIAGSVFSFLALGAVVLAWRQLTASKEELTASKEDAANANAAGMQTALLVQALEYPQFIAPEDEHVNVADEEFMGKTIEFRRYEAYVELVLTTFEYLVQSYADDKPTRKYMIQTLSLHYKYLDSGYFRKYFLEQLSPELRKLIEDGIKYAFHEEVRSAA